MCQIIVEQLRDLGTLGDLELLRKDLCWELDMDDLDLEILFGKAEAVLDSVGELHLSPGRFKKLEQMTSELFKRCGTPSAARELCGEIVNEVYRPSQSGDNSLEEHRIFLNRQGDNPDVKKREEVLTLERSFLVLWSLFSITSLLM